MNIKAPLVALALAALTAGSVGDCGSDSSSPPGTCGNGMVESGEACDGTPPPGSSCMASTMGARPFGMVACTNCQIDTTACMTTGGGGAPGTGGGVSAAGTPVTAGAPGTGGGP